MTPSNELMQKWLKKKLPQKDWSNIKSTVAKFRKSLPIVSHITPDNKKSSKGKKALGQTFAAPTWISADLGKMNKILSSSILNLNHARFFSAAWKKLRKFFYCCTNYVRPGIYKEN